MPTSHDRPRPRSLQPSAELNVTPLIDVLLVLLIIFMTVLPIKQLGLDVNLPIAEAPREPVARPTQIVLEYDADRRVTINSQAVELAAVGPRLREIFATRHDRTLFVRGDGSLRYGEVVKIIDAARGAGVTRVGVITPGAVAQAK